MSFFISFLGLREERGGGERAGGRGTAAKPEDEHKRVTWEEPAVV